MDKRSIAAWLLDCKPEELLSFADYESHVVAIGPDGRKSYFDDGQLAKGEKGMALELPLGVATRKTRKRPGTRKRRK